MSVSLLAYAPLRQRHQNASVTGASGGKVTEMSLIVFRLLPALTQERTEAVMIDVTAHAHVYGRPNGAWAYDEIARKKKAEGPVDCDPRRDRRLCLK
jgi:hypothetical protein